MSILKVDNLKFSYGENDLFNNVNFDLHLNDHMGLIGANGSGKTTLLNLISHKIYPDRGSIKWDNKTSYSYLDQHLKIDTSISIEKYLYDVYKDLFDKEKEMNKLYKSLEDPLDLDIDKILNKAYNIQSYLEEKDFYLIKSKIGNVLNGLGVNVEDDRLLNELSSGQRVKVFLAKMLLEEKDVLLLDEPTNFLDAIHVDWLSKFLVNYKKAFIVISHDYVFLNSITNCIANLENKDIVKYRGNFESFLVQKSLRDDFYQKEYDAQQKRIKSLKEFVDKNIVRATTSKRAKSRQKILNKIEVMEKPQSEKKVHFDFKFTSGFNRKALILNDLCIGYNSSLLAPMNFDISFGEKVVILGKNGIGKTTFIKTILGKIPVISGSYKLDELNKVLYYQQEEKIENITPIQYIKNLYILMPDEDIRKLLARYGVRGRLALKTMDKLSGGELTKVRFARLSLEKSNLLILDEPTNHLDNTAKIALFEAIDKYEGTVIIVSHEKEFYKKLKMKEIKFE
ncbi:MAG: ABC-F family ATP-binding cassette domain-containing protein [Bacilli bacterium]|nr:ABC-F family ATP-binding cassette domain-containing protein [Bacilli bacterium]